MNDVPWYWSAFRGLGSLETVVDQNDEISHPALLCRITSECSHMRLDGHSDTG